MRRGRYGFWLRLAVAVLRPPLVLLTRRDWRHTERLPRAGGAVIVPNHNTHLDPLIIAHVVWDNGRIPRFLAKAGLFRVPVVGRVLRECGQIPVERDSRDATSAYAAAVAAVQRGEAVIVYPEGTVTRDPQLWPMVGKTGAARIALATGVPVVPLAQWGAHEILAPYSTRPRLLPRKTVHVSVGPPVELADLAERELTAEVLRTATSRIMDALTRHLESLRGERAPAQRFDPKRAGVPITGNPKRRRTPTGDPTQLVAADDRERP